MSLLVFVIALTINPHPDLWLSDASFARLHCTKELKAYFATCELLRATEELVARRNTPDDRARLDTVKGAEAEQLTELEAAISAARNRGRRTPGQFIRSMTPIPPDPWE